MVDEYDESVVSESLSFKLFVNALNSQTKIASINVRGIAKSSITKLDKPKTN